VCVMSCVSCHVCVMSCVSMCVSCHVCVMSCVSRWRMTRKSSRWHSSSVSGLQVSVETRTTLMRRPSPAYSPVATRPNQRCQYQYKSWSWLTFHRSCVYQQHCCQHHQLDQQLSDLPLSAVPGFVSSLLADWVLPLCGMNHYETTVLLQLKCWLSCSLPQMSQSRH